MRSRPHCGVPLNPAALRSGRIPGATWPGPSRHVLHATPAARSLPGTNGPGRADLRPRHLRATSGPAIARRASLEEEAGIPGGNVMSGPVWALFVIPVVAFVVLAVMILGVYYADAHPGWAGQGPAPQQPGTEVTGAPGQRPEVPRQATSPEAGSEASGEVVSAAGEEAGSAAAPASGSTARR